jgi:hypothetical protein
MKDFLTPDLFRSPSSERQSREEHSRLLDVELGYRINDIEKSLLEDAKRVRPGGHLWSLGQGIHGGNQTWVGLDLQMLQTPYDEIREMFQLINLADVLNVVDLGAGYGRLGVYLHALSPRIKFTGFEYVGERVREGMRIYRAHGISGELIEQDLTAENFSLPLAQVYFLYDFGEPAHIRGVLDQLSHFSSHRFFLIARGKGSRSLVDLKYPWLTVHPVIHRENFAIYSSSAD